MSRKLINIIIFLLITITAYSQSVGDVNHFTINEGLSQSSITCIYQSKDGIIWIGTKDGLNEYDGYEFLKIKNNPQDTNSLSNNYINDITEDDKGNLIIATNSGISIWKRSENVFQRINIIKNKKGTNEDNEIYQVAFINNIIWALSKRNLIKITKNELKKYPYYVDTNELIDNHMTQKTDLLINTSQNLWFTTTNGLEIFYPKSERFYRVYDNSNNNLSNNIVQCIYEKDNNVWLGTHIGLNKFVKKTGLIENIYFYKNIKKEVSENDINCIIIDRNNKFWIGTNQGIKTFNGEELCDFENEKIKKINRKISYLLIDNSNNIWIGTKFDGLYMISLDQSKFNNYTDFPYENKYIFAINYNTNDQLWIGTRGLFIFDFKTKKTIFQSDLKKKTTDPEITVYSILKDSTIFWLGTTNGIFIINSKTFKIKTFNNYFKDIKNKEALNIAIFNIIKDKNNVYWIGSSNGLYKFKGKELINYNSKKKNSISSKEITKLLDADNKLWICTFDGLNVLDKKTDKFKSWTLKDGLPSNLITDIYKENNDSIVWVSTSGGLSRFNYNKEIFTNFTSGNTGFINDFFYQILTDNNNNLWISSNNGIVKFNIKTHIFYTYTQRDGLPFLEFNSGASFKTDNNLLFFGGSGGIVWCNPNEKDSFQIPPPVIFTKIEFKSSFQDKKTIYFPDTLKTYQLKYNEIVNIYFTLPDYHNSLNNKYQFKIIGLNNKWSELQKENVITLMGLAPGKYTMIVKGMNTFGKWNNKYTKIKIEIIPTFDKSNMFKILIIAIIVILVAIIVIYIFRNVKKENKILLEKNEALKKIDEQKKLLEEKNISITDSINYAKKIIDAILPPENQMKNIIPESFIYYLPKDIVSGDFYWFVEKNDNIFIAAVDCTGHGIPGAFMSIIGMNLLSQLVNEGISDPSVILNMMNKEVILTLKKKLDSAHLKDGMDMSLAIIDKKRNIIKFSSAYNPAYIIRDNNIIQLKGERKSVGNDFDFDSFSTFSMKIRKDDIVYLFSDGYTDQFGGSELKKFKFRRYRFILLSIHQLPFDKQKEKLMETFELWRGNNEQVDDILIIGFKPLSFSN